MDLPRTDGFRRTIPGVSPDLQDDWKWQLGHLIKSGGELLRFLGGKAPAPDLGFEGELRITPYYAGLIRPFDENDPILRQIMPHPSEQSLQGDGALDPLAERRHSPVAGLVHRYPDRVLLLPTGFCPTLCRFCLRRRNWSETPGDVPFDLDAVLDYLRSHEEIRDVILSGGDPLFLAPRRLEEILHGVKNLAQVRIVRIGTRAPVTLPMRIDAELTDLLSRFRPLWILTHFNHPREVTAEARQALDRLISAGLPVNNQTVLLRGVNDSAEVLMELSMRLLENGVRPYYLHQMDGVAGAERFTVPVEEGIGIVEKMFGGISGLGIPRYTLDLPGGRGKVPLTPGFIEAERPGTWLFKSPLGGFVEVPRVPLEPQTRSRLG